MLRTVSLNDVEHFAETLTQISQLTTNLSAKTTTERTSKIQYWCKFKQRNLHLNLVCSINSYIPAIY